MTLQETQKKGSPYGFNEITGTLIEFQSSKKCCVVLRGDVASPTSVCQLLFDNATIDTSWGSMTIVDAERRILASVKRASPVISIDRAALMMQI